MTHKLVFVIWEDSWSSDASATREDAIDRNERPYLLTTAGLLIDQDASGVTIGRDQYEDGRFRSLLHIPECAVRQLQFFEVTP